MAIFTRLLWVAFGPLGALGAEAQTVVGQFSHASLRGLCAVDEKVIWVSGSGGTVGRSTDGGATWTRIAAPGFEKTDFRDIQAFDSATALIMGIDTPALILRTTDAGRHWTTVLRDETPGMFLDAMDFSTTDKRIGVVVGDPVNARFYLAMTGDTGKTWTPLAPRIRPLADSGEGCFASSGTNIRVTSPGVFAFVSGGPETRLISDEDTIPLPLVHGAVSTGANSLATYKRWAVIVGGDFAHDTISTGNAAYSADGGAHWRGARTPPHGYRSCVIHITGDTWLCCGTSGIDISKDGGYNWTLVSRDSYHVAAYSGNGKYVFLAGAGGRIAKLDWTKL